MPYTYTQFHVHTIFAVKFRRALIKSEWRDDLYRYIAGIIKYYDHRLLAIGGMPDHLHVFLGMRPSQSVSDLIQGIKGSSSKWINDSHLVPGRFQWQEGYGAFTYSKSQASNVIAFIHNQDSFHAKRDFIDEYRQLLINFGVEYKEKHLFKLPE